MDKKQNFYSRQGSSRALVTEPRKSSDVCVNKPRSARRRENPNLSSGKNETQRSSKPAKVRPFVDKRPRARGGSSSQLFNLSSASSGLAEDDVAYDGPSNELSSIYNQGSKKQNLNHLLNFHYAPREHEGSVNASFFGRNGNRNNLKKQKYNKEQFLQANFQFVVKSSAESSIVSASPDTLVDWALIEQINIQTTEEPQCPICLYPPVAAKLTRCGHAYCWPCILHYLALTDKNWRKCPICYDAIHLSDLKSTAIVQQADIKVSDFVDLQLMRRKKGSMFIEKMGDEEHNQKIPHLAVEFDQKKFSKFVLADSYEILSIIDREKQELISTESEDCPEFVFIQQALDLLNERKSTMLKEMGAIEGDDNEEISLDKINLNEIEISPDGKLDDEKPKDSQPVKMDQNFTPQLTSLKTSKEQAKYYYFYQSIDGQNIFLHPLNVKMLQAMYGSLEKAPQHIKAQILQKEFQSMDEDHRKKFTCLSHLPLTCQFEIVEVQLEPPIISEEILSLFRGDIMLRQKARMRRAREEKKREKQIFEINERQMGKIISRSANIDIQSSQQFPMCGSDEGSIRSSFGEAFSFDLSDSPPAVLPSSTKANYTSFANVLSSPKKEFWPSLGGVKDTSTSASEGAWGKPAVVAMAANTSADNYDLTSDQQEPNFIRQNLGDVLAEALQQKKVSADSNNTEKKTGATKKVKKCKKTLLLSTGMSFGGN